MCAVTTYLLRYHNLIDVKYNHVVYDSFLQEEKRIIITRWRLNNHELKVETGRYEIPYLERHLRVCSLCSVLEDENHVLFDCPFYDDIRMIFGDFWLGILRLK